MKNKKRHCYLYVFLKNQPNGGLEYHNTYRLQDDKKVTLLDIVSAKDGFEGGFLLNVCYLGRMSESEFNGANEIVN